MAALLGVLDNFVASCARALCCCRGTGCCVWRVLCCARCGLCCAPLCWLALFHC